MLLLIYSASTHDLCNLTAGKKPEGPAPALAHSSGDKFKELEEGQLLMRKSQEAKTANREAANNEGVTSIQIHWWPVERILS